MLKCFFTAALLLLAPLGFASDSNYSIQDIVKNKYGTCYKTIGDAISRCGELTCVYPDFSNQKVWRANVIRDFQGDKCYAIYYSYLGSEIIGEYLDCFYTTEQRAALSNLYAALFSTGLAIEMASAETQINSINSIACKLRNNGPAQ